MVTKGTTMTPTRSSLRTLLGLLAVLALFTAACSSDTTTAAPTTTEAEPAETTTAAPTTVAEAEEEPAETTEAPAEGIALESAACAFQPPDSVDVECGWVTVPQNWDDPSDPDTIRLHVATFTNDQTPADAVPVVYLEGGPYHSVASANDADAIRAALGHDQWNVLGISYGTRLGQELVRHHPDGIRALILDSVQPTDPNLGSLAALPRTFQGSLDELFAGCEASTECNTANPNLKDRLSAVLDDLAITPIEVAAADQLTGEEYTAIVDDERMLGLVFNALYSPETFSALPEMVAQLEAGETGIVEALLGLQITNSAFISNGMYAAVMCHDFLAELTPSSAWDAGLVDEPLFEDRFGGLEEGDVDAMCGAFPTGSMIEASAEPVGKAPPCRASTPSKSRSGCRQASPAPSSSPSRTPSSVSPVCSPRAGSSRASA